MKVHKTYSGRPDQWGAVGPTNAIIEATPEEIESKTGMATGMEVATIEVRHPDDGITRFWISLRVTKQGRVKCEVATNVIGSKCGATKSKSLVGTKWPNPRDPNLTA